jgi:hypothetical protein
MSMRLWLAPLPKPSTRLDRLRWLRRMYLQGALLLVPMLIIGALWSRIVLIVALAALALQLVGFLTLRAQIRAERQRTL